MPAWDITIPIGDGYTIPALFWPTVVLPGMLTMLPMFYPFIEARLRKDKQSHHLLQRPRDVPARTALGAMAIGFYLVLLISGGNDVVAEKLDISLNAMTWVGRVGLLVVPPLAYYITYRICLGLQQHDREVLAHGVETGIIRRLPDGRFIEVHQPLAPVDEHGHGALEYAGAPIPKKMNRLGAVAPAVRGLLPPGREARHARPAAGRDPGVAGRRAGRHWRCRGCRPRHPVRGRGDGAGRARPTLIHRYARARPPARWAGPFRCGRVMFAGLVPACGIPPVRIEVSQSLHVPPARCHRPARVHRERRRIPGGRLTRDRGHPPAEARRARQLEPTQRHQLQRLERRHASIRPPGPSTPSTGRPTSAPPARTSPWASTSGSPATGTTSATATTRR